MTDYDTMQFEWENYVANCLQGQNPPVVQACKLAFFAGVINSACKIRRAPDKDAAILKIEEEVKNFVETARANP